MTTPNTSLIKILAEVATYQDTDKSPDEWTIEQKDICVQYFNLFFSWGKLKAQEFVFTPARIR